MMLQALTAYAEREGLGDPDFESVGVRWLIPITETGKLASSPIPLSDNPDDNKPRPKRLTRPKSDPDFVAHGRSYFLCDSLERALLFVEDPEKLEKRRLNQTYFVGLLEEAAKSCPTMCGRLTALAAFLQNNGEIARVHAALAKVKAKGSENAAFSIDGIELLRSNELSTYWRSRCAVERAKTDTPAVTCLASGRVGPVCRTTGFIKLLGEDTKLISFNKECPAFESFGLSQATNAPVGLDAEVKFRAAFNRLIEISREQRLVFNDSVHLHWTRKPVDFDPLDPLGSGDPTTIERLLRSVQEGRQFVDLDPNDYYMMSLSGNGARIVVRDWLASTVPEVAKHVAQWFKDLAIVPPEGAGLKRDFKFGALLYGMVRDELDELPPQLTTQLLHAAMRGAPLPQTALVAAVRRQHLDQKNKLHVARIALIKACLLRSTHRKETDTMTEKLDPESVDCAYLCGQLFAVIGRLQLLALGRIGASIADRTYGGVATRPASTLGPVFTKLTPYLKKANTRFPGSGTNKQKEIEGLCSRLTKLGGFPKTLGLEEQGRFALGYYSQLAQYRADRAEADAAEKAETIPELSN